MDAALPGGGFVEIRRRWLPWRLRKRGFEAGFPDFVSGADDLSGVALGLVMGLVWFLIGGLVLTVAVFAGEALLLVLLLIPLLAAARMVTVLPWVIEAVRGETVLGVAKVRGWRESEETMRAITAAYQRGEDPFPVRDAA